MKQISNATESARSMAREVEDGERYGDDPRLIQGAREDMHRHLDKADRSLNAARTDTERESTKRQEDSGSERKGWFW
jgi:hypothetical protein